MWILGQIPCSWSSGSGGLFPPRGHDDNPQTDLGLRERQPIDTGCGLCLPKQLIKQSRRLLLRQSQCGGCGRCRFKLLPLTRQPLLSHLLLTPRQRGGGCGLCLTSYKQDQKSDTKNIGTVLMGYSAHASFP